MPDAANAGTGTTPIVKGSGSGSGVVDLPFYRSSGVFRVWMAGIALVRPHSGIFDNRGCLSRLVRQTHPNRSDREIVPGGNQRSETIGMYRADTQERVEEKRKAMMMISPDQPFLAGWFRADRL